MLPMLRFVSQPSVVLSSVLRAPISESRGPLPASDRLRVAWQRRHETDYVFSFPTALAWTVVTAGVYGLNVLYQLLRRAHEHNRRRLALIEAATAFTWEQARTHGLSDELRPNFQAIADQTRALNELTYEFRDPALWVALSVATLGIAQFFAWRAIDRDLVKHEAAERAIEHELAYVYARLGWEIAPMEHAAPKPLHNVTGRVIATVLTGGIYAIWWVRDLMVEGNAHLRENWQFEDGLARASRSLMAA